jgi:hypothetical protein
MNVGCVKPKNLAIIYKFFYSHMSYNHCWHFLKYILHYSTY